MKHLHFALLILLLCLTLCGCIRGGGEGAAANPSVQPSDGCVPEVPEHAEFPETEKVPADIA